MALVHHHATLALFGYFAILTVVQIWAMFFNNRRFRHVHFRLDEISAEIEVSIAFLKNSLDEISARVDALESKSRLKKIA